MSTLSIPGTMKAVGDRNREEEGALVGVHAEFPKYTEEKKKGSYLIPAGNNTVLFVFPLNFGAQNP